MISTLVDLWCLARLCLCVDGLTEPHPILYLVGDDATPDDPERPGGRQERQDCTRADCSQDVVVAFEHLGLLAVLSSMMDP